MEGDVEIRTLREIRMRTAEATQFYRGPTKKRKQNSIIKEPLKRHLKQNFWKLCSLSSILNEGAPPSPQSVDIIVCPFGQPRLMIVAFERQEFGLPGYRLLQKSYQKGTTWQPFHQGTIIICFFTPLLCTRTCISSVAGSCNIALTGRIFYHLKAPIHIGLFIFFESELTYTWKLNALSTGSLLRIAPTLQDGSP